MGDPIHWVFLDWIHAHPPKYTHGYEHLGDYFHNWLVLGRGAVACGGDLAVFMKAFIDVADGLTGSPRTLVGYYESYEIPRVIIERPVKRLIDPLVCYRCRVLFDPISFQVFVDEPDLIAHRGDTLKQWLIGVDDAS